MWISLPESCQRPSGQLKPFPDSVYLLQPAVRNRSTSTFSLAVDIVHTSLNTAPQKLRFFSLLEECYEPAKILDDCGDHKMKTQRKKKARPNRRFMFLSMNHRT